MKILFCAKHLMGTGGQEGFLRRFCSFLVARGHDVELLAAGADPVPGASCTCVTVPRWIGRAAWDWAAARAVVAESRHHARDVCFGGQKTWGCNVIRPGGGVEVEYWRIKLSDRYAWPPMRRFTQKLSVKRRFDLNAESRAYHDPALRYVVANSEMVRRGLLRFYPTLADKIHVIYNGADTKRFSPCNDAAMRTHVHRDLDLDPSLLTAVFAAHNFRLKGLPQALAAIERVSRHATCQFIVMGGGRSRNMRGLVRRLGLDGVVRFVGNTHEPEQYYAASDLLLFPTFYDPCANVTFEALACGLPVVTTRRNGASELITNGREGWTVSHPNCVEQMASHIAALHDPTRLADMKEAAAALAAAHPMSDTLGHMEDILTDASRLR